MQPAVLVVLAAVAAALIAWVGPFAIAALPEPEDPPADKLPYAEVAQLPGIRWWLVIPAALAAGLVAWRIEVPELIPVWVAVCGIGSWLAFVDSHTRYLPYVLTAPLYVLVLLLVIVGALWAGDVDLLVHALIGNVVLYLVYRLMYWIGGRFFGGAFGYGDVRLSAVLGLALGAAGAAETTVGAYAAFLLGGLIAPILVWLRVVDRSAFAFGPYMLVGAVIGLAWGGSLYTT